MPELLDRVSSAERESVELEQLQAEAISKFQESGTNIDRDRWQNVIPSVKYGDLNSAKANQSTAKYRPKYIFAGVEENGQVTVDRVEFSKLSEPQKLHAILHEAGHRLDWLISATGNEHWLEIGDLITETDPDEVSFYIHHLIEKYQQLPPEELAKIVRQEAMPELIAQFVESGGTFKGFVEARMRSGAGQKGEEAWAGRTEVDTVMTKLDRFESMSEEEKEAFFIEHPRFQKRFHIFVNLGEVLKDDKLIESITTEWGGDYDNGFDDELEMVSEMAPEPPKILNAPLKKEMPPKKKGWFDLFWPFRSDS